MAVKRLIQVATTGEQSEYTGVASSAGAGNADDLPRLDAAGKLSSTFMPTGVGADSISATAAEALSAGDFVYFNASGAVLKADATSPAKAARGYVNTAVANAGTATVFFDDSNTGVTGLTPGTTYYLSATAGGVTAIPTTTTGQILQELGFATSATSLHTNIQEPITRA